MLIDVTSEELKMLERALHCYRVENNLDEEDSKTIQHLLDLFDARRS